MGALSLDDDVYDSIHTFPVTAAAFSFGNHAFSYCFGDEPSCGRCSCLILAQNGGVSSDLEWVSSFDDEGVTRHNGKKIQRTACVL